MAEKLLAIYEKVRGPDHPITATSLNNLVVLYKSMGDYDKAEPIYQRSLAIREKSFGPQHPDTAAIRGEEEIQEHRFFQAAFLFQRWS